MKIHLTTTECHLPYGITQCYLPPDTSEHPAFIPAWQAGTRFTEIYSQILRISQKNRDSKAMTIIPPLSCSPLKCVGHATTAKCPASVSGQHVTLSNRRAQYWPLSADVYKNIITSASVSLWLYYAYINTRVLQLYMYIGVVRGSGGNSFPRIRDWQSNKNRIKSRNGN